MAYQSLYRRYRPQTFGQVVGQDRVTTTLRNAVRDGRVSHAYLFSGPRGTGKTSTARILAKALNCTNLQDGEPCCECESCRQVASGASLDVMELDAASNNGVDAMRDLISRAALGTAGRAKVYIVDEVHMLSTGASNALLKTLEEPPGHVYFVLATTDPQKVLPTIRSRTQHFEFRLLSHDDLRRHLQWVVDDAGLDVAPEAIELVARRGNGSARDALSALDQVAAAGGIDDEASPVDEIVEALCEHDAGRALAAVADSCARGGDPRQLARDLVEHLRNAFLALLARPLVPLPDDAVEQVAEQARRLGAPTVTRAIETIGDTLVGMRDTLDPRIALEVALVRLARPEADVSPAALLDRLERLERRVAGQAAAPEVAAAHHAVERPARPAPPAAPPRTVPAPPTPPSRPAAAGSTPPPAPPVRPRPADAARAALGATGTPPPPAARGGAPRPPAPPPAPAAAAEPARPAAFPSRDELALAWGDTVLDALPGPAKAYWREGRWESVDERGAVFAVPQQLLLDRCARHLATVEGALAAHFGGRVAVRLVVDTAAPPARREAGPPPDPDPADFDPSELTDAPAGVTSHLDHLLQAFPGAVPVEE